MFTKFSRKDYNFKLLVLVMTVITIGIVVINSADSSFTVRQIVGAVMGLFVMLFVSVLNYDFICKFANVFYIINAP